MSTSPKSSGIQCPFCGSDVWDMDPDPIVVPDLNSDSCYLKVRVRCTNFKCSLSSYRIVGKSLTR